MEKEARLGLTEKEARLGLTEKEVKVLSYINDHYSKKFALKIDVEKIAEACDLNPLHVKEMLERFKEKKLIKKSNNAFYFVIEAAIEVLFEILGGI